LKRRWLSFLTRGGTRFVVVYINRWPTYLVRNETMVLPIHSSEWQMISSALSGV
jgi:hypothetical protein